MFKIFKEKNLKNQKIALLGLGQENQAFLLWLLKNKYPGKITICDKRDQNFFEKKIRNKVNWQTGDSYKKDLDKFDYLFRSPGWPLNCPAIIFAKSQGVKISSPMNAFFLESPSSNIIGVTGTKGKGTTASLIYTILKTAKKSVFLGGNIGIAPFSFISKIKPKDYIVLELSSFQLEDLKISPKIAVITNFFPDHLKAADPFNPNYHQSLSKYWQAKANIFKHKNNQYLIINQKLKKKIKKEKNNTKVIYFTNSSLSSKLQGKYNQENIGAAVKVSECLKIPNTIIEKAVLNFKNLEHRLELVKEKDKIKFFNNSFATNPNSTILDLESFQSPIIQIAGGADKGSNFKELAKIIKKKVKYLILLPGQSSLRIKEELENIAYPKNKIKLVKSMKTAVLNAYKQAKKGDIVLLSTACASFGIFKNYKERGKEFKKYVK
jgi:UDP-N-acetylmuramoylalanine--D-glutamate ligase